MPSSSLSSFATNNCLGLTSAAFEIEACHDGQDVILESRVGWLAETMCLNLWWVIPCIGLGEGEAMEAFIFCVLSRWTNHNDHITRENWGWNFFEWVEKLNYFSPKREKTPHKNSNLGQIWVRLDIIPGPTMIIRCIYYINPSSLQMIIFIHFFTCFKGFIRVKRQVAMGTTIKLELIHLNRPIIPALSQHILF